MLQDDKENNDLEPVINPCEEKSFEKCKNYLSEDLNNIYDFVLNPDGGSESATLSFDNY